MQSGSEPRGVLRPAAGSLGGGSPPQPEPRSPGPPAAPLAARRREEGRGEAIPGDFTLLEAPVFRHGRCHPRGFSLLLHRHLPPSPAGRPGEPGQGVAVRRRRLSAGSRLPDTAASGGAEPPARGRAAQPGRSPRLGLRPSALRAAGGTPRRWTLRLARTGKRERGQRGTATTHTLREQEARSDPDVDRPWPEVTPARRRPPAGAWPCGAVCGRGGAAGSRVVVVRPCEALGLCGSPAGPGLCRGAAACPSCWGPPALCGPERGGGAGRGAPAAGPPGAPAVALPAPAQLAVQVRGTRRRPARRGGPLPDPPEPCGGAEPGGRPACVRAAGARGYAAGPRATSDRRSPRGLRLRTRRLRPLARDARCSVRRAPARHRGVPGSPRAV